VNGKPLPVRSNVIVTLHLEDQKIEVPFAVMDVPFDMILERPFLSLVHAQSDEKEDLLVFRKLRLCLKNGILLNTTKLYQLETFPIRVVEQILTPLEEIESAFSSTLFDESQEEYINLAKCIPLEPDKTDAIAKSTTST